MDFVQRHLAQRPGVKIALATVFVILCWAYSPIGIRIGLGLTSRDIWR